MTLLVPPDVAWDELGQVGVEKALSGGIGVFVSVPLLLRVIMQILPD